MRFDCFDYRESKMATLSVDECGKSLPEMNHLPGAEIIKICDNLTVVVKSSSSPIRSASFIHFRIFKNLTKI